MNQGRIDQIWAEIVRLEKQKGEGVSMQTQEQIDAQIKGLEDERAALEAAEQAEVETAIEQEHEIRVIGAASQFDEYLKTPAFGGMTLREVIADETVYQLATIGLKKVYASQAEASSKLLKDQTALHIGQMKISQDREDQLKRQNEILQNKIMSVVAELEETKNQLGQEKLERANAEQGRLNAVAQLEESQAEVARLNGHVDDLRAEIAIGASGAINVVNTEEERIKEEQLQRELLKQRTIYNLEWVDDIKQNKYKARYAATGEPLEFPWTEKTKYIVIPESEVLSFRQQYAISINPEVPDVVEAPVQSNTPVVQEPQFPVITPPEVIGAIYEKVQLEDSQPESGGSSEEAIVTESRLETRLAQLKAEIIAEIQGEKVA